MNTTKTADALTIASAAIAKDRAERECSAAMAAILDARKLTASMWAAHTEAHARFMAADRAYVAAVWQQ